MPIEQRIAEKHGEAKASYEKSHIYSVSETDTSLKVVLAYFIKDSDEADLIEVEAQK